ncbi:hypothetical protein WMF28_36390 [Sorangium sp. So ce590]|uniref:hypothetical protein n=1 Tax=Sorangium sp. So ce590 TaxID=3133317 RepID=UPI003F5E5B95
MKAPKDITAALKDPSVSLAPWSDPVWCATTPKAEKKRLAEVRARRVMEIDGIEDARMEACLVQFAGWVEKWAAEERAAEQEADNEAWVSMAPAEAEQRSKSRLAQVGAVLLVVGLVCGVVLAALRLR